MEKKLRKLFDFQRFAVNPALQSVIDQTHSRLDRSILSDDDMELVAAAGQPLIRETPFEEDRIV